MFELSHVKYQYEKNKKVLDDITFTFEAGKVYSIVGPSGAGKSTILLLLAGLDSPTEGLIKVKGTDIKETGYDEHRRKDVALIFQQYNLIQYMSALENIRLVNPKADKEILLGLNLTEDEIKRKVTHLSGGQQQRVAIGRALASGAPIILADEPTGNLDEETAEEMLTIFLDLAHRENKCVIIVTHSKELAKKTDVVLKLSGKKLIEQ